VMVLCKLNGHPDLACAESSCGLALAAVVPDHHAKRGDVQSIPRCHVRSQPRPLLAAFASRNRTSAQVSLPQLADKS
jgi:hypothetical protein